MKVHCTACKKIYHSAADLVPAKNTTVTDLKGQWKTVCPFCGAENFTNVVTKPISVVLSEDAMGKRHFEDFFDGKQVKEHLSFDNVAEFMKWWEKAIENQPSMWYHVIHNGMQLCSGAIDPYDIDIWYECFPELYHQRIANDNILKFKEESQNLYEEENV